MNISNELSVKEISKVLKQYYFYNGEKFKIIPLSKSSFSLTTRIKSPKFDLVLKRYKSTIQPERFLLSHKVSLELNKRKFPCPKLEKNRYDETITKSDRFYYIVKQWIDGKNINPANIAKSKAIKIIAQIGRIVGLYHKIVSEININDKNRNRFITANSLFRNPNLKYKKISKWDGIKPSLKIKIRFWRKKSKFDRWILSYLSETYKNVKYLYKFPISNYPSLAQYIPALNDIDWDNILFRGDKLVGLIDFDNVIICPREWDIGAAAAMICGNNTEYIQIFLQEYYSISGYKPDLTILPTTMRLKYLSVLLWSINLHYDRNQPDYANLEKWCYHIADCISWLDDNEDVLLDIKLQ